MTPSTGFDEMARLLAFLPADARGRMVGMYRGSLRTHLEELAAALQPVAPETALGLAHKIAGSAAMMQDRDLSGSAREMERSLRAGQVDEALRLWPLVRQHAAGTLDYLQQLG